MESEQTLSWESANAELEVRADVEKSRPWLWLLPQRHWRDALSDNPGRFGALGCFRAVSVFRSVFIRCGSVLLVCGKSWGFWILSFGLDIVRGEGFLGTGIQESQ